MGSASLCAEKPRSSPEAQPENRIDSTAGEDGGITPAGEELDCIVYGPHSDVTGFEALRREWNPLLSRSRFDTVFLTHEWLSTWWEYLGEGELWILAFRRPQNGELVGIVPLYLTGSHRHRAWLLHRHAHLVPGRLHRSQRLPRRDRGQGWEPAVFRAFLRWLYSEDAPAWDVVDLCNLAPGQPHLCRFPAPGRGEGRRRHRPARGRGAAVSRCRCTSRPISRRWWKRSSAMRFAASIRRAEREAEIGFHMASRRATT